MLEWIAHNKDWLGPIFGAGGAGAVLLAALVDFRWRGTKATQENEPSGGIIAKAEGGGVAVAHGGRGNVDMRVNEAVGARTIEDLQDRLEISLPEAARLLKAFQAAGLGTAEGRAAVERITEDVAAREALVTALRQDDVARAAVLVERSATPPSQQSG